MKILYTNSNTVRSKFLRYWDRTSCSDVALQLGSGQILHSTDRGLQINLPDYYLRDKQVWMVQDLGQNWILENSVMKNLSKFEQIPYSTIQKSRRYVIIQLLGASLEMTPQKLINFFRVNPQLLRSDKLHLNNNK